MPTPADRGAQGVDRPRPPRPGLVEYVAYGPVRARVAGQPDVLGFGPVASSLTGLALEHWDRWFGAYAVPAGSRTGPSVCRLVDGDWAVIAVRDEGVGDPLRDSRGYLLLGSPADLTVDLALRLWPSTPEGAAPGTREYPEARGDTGTGHDVESRDDPGSRPETAAHGDERAAATDRPDGEPSEPSFVAVFQTLADAPGAAGGRGEPLTVAALDGLALPTRRIADRSGAVSQEALARLVAGVLRYGSAIDRDVPLLLPGRDEVDGQALLWCLCGLLRHPVLRPVAGEPTFVRARDWPLPGAPARPTPRIVHLSSTSFHQFSQERPFVRLDDDWTPELAVFARAGELLAREYLAELAATRPDYRPSAPPPDAADGGQFAARLARLDPIDPANPLTVAAWCTSLLEAKELAATGREVTTLEARVAELEAREARLRDELAGRAAERLAAQSERRESAARLAAADAEIHRLRAEAVAKPAGTSELGESAELDESAGDPGERRADLVWALLLVAVVELLVIAILTT